MAKKPARKRKGPESKGDKSEADGKSNPSAKKAGKGEKAKKERKQKTAHEQKPPAMPFGDVLPGYKERGSPADGNWMASGDPDRDIAALEAQERFIYRIMVRAKAERDVAKANRNLLMTQAEETSVTDGFPVSEKISLHKKADAAEIVAAKADKQYKRAREGWNSIKGTIHRYLTEPEQPLFEQGKKKAEKKAA